MQRLLTDRDRWWAARSLFQEAIKGSNIYRTYAAYARARQNPGLPPALPRRTQRASQQPRPCARAGQQPKWVGWLGQLDSLELVATQECSGARIDARAFCTPPFSEYVKVNR